MTDLFNGGDPPAEPVKRKRPPKQEPPVAEAEVQGEAQEVMPPEAPPTGTALVVLDNPAITAVQVFGSQKNADDIIATLTRDARAEAAKLDISTKKGREGIASLAYKIAKSKTALDNLGKEMNEAKRAEINQVDAERRRLKEAIQTLQDDIRKPLTDWENADKLRIEAHEEALLVLENAAVFPTPEPTVEEIDARVTEILPLMQRSWDEFETRAIAATDVARRDLIALRARTVQREADRVELERLREQERQREIEREAEEQKKREAQIAKEAADAERIKADAEKQAIIDAAENARKDRHETDIRTVKSMISAASAPFQASDHIKASAQLFEDSPLLTRDFEEFQDEVNKIILEGRAAIAEALQVAEDREEAKRIRDAEAAEAQKLASDRAAEDARLAGIETERKRQQEAQEAAEADRLKRERNKQHAAKIHLLMVQDLMKILPFNEATDDSVGEMTIDQAKAIVEAIARGQISHVKIEY